MYRAMKTVVMFNGEDISRLVIGLDLRRFPELEEQATMTLLVDRLEVRKDGTLVIHVGNPSGR